MKTLAICLFVTLTIISAPTSRAVTVEWSDVDLASGGTRERKGVTFGINRPTDLENITDGEFTGLLVNGNQNQFRESFVRIDFPVPVLSLEIEFEALNSAADGQLYGFTNSAGSVEIDYTSQAGTTFSAGVIDATGSNGQGIIRFSASEPFSFFGFTQRLDGTDSPASPGFIMERFKLVTPGIGVVKAGIGTVVRTNGERHAIERYDLLFEGDIVESPAGQVLFLIFDDETKITVGFEDGKLVLDEYVYDPDKRVGSMTGRFFQGRL